MDVAKLAQSFASIERPEAYSHDGWKITRTYKNVDESYTAYIISCPESIDASEEAMCFKVFDCIVDTFNFSIKKNIQFIEEGGCYSALIPGKCELPMDMLIKEITARFNRKA